MSCASCEMWLWIWVNGPAIEAQGSMTTKFPQTSHHGPLSFLQAYKCRTGVLMDPCAANLQGNGTSQAQEEVVLVVRKTAPISKGCRNTEKIDQGVNLYPTPRMEWKCLGLRGSGSKYFLNATRKLSTVRVVGNTL